MTSIAEQLREALSLRGRTTDMRQARGLHGRGDHTPLGSQEVADYTHAQDTSPFAIVQDTLGKKHGPDRRHAAHVPVGPGHVEPDPMGWVIHFPRDQYPSTKEYQGVVPMMLVGHMGLDNSQSDVILRVVRAAHEAFHAAPVAPETARITKDPSTLSLLGIELKRVVPQGDLHAIFATLFPGGAEVLDEVVRYIDNAYMHPMASGQLALARTDSVYSVAQLIRALSTLHKGLLEPKRRDVTQGDILNYTNWPFGTVGTEP
jgi:hypothetical protein